MSSNTNTSPKHAAAFISTLETPVCFSQYTTSYLKNPPVKSTIKCSIPSERPAILSHDNTFCGVGTHPPALHPCVTDLFKLCPYTHHAHHHHHLEQKKPTPQLEPYPENEIEYLEEEEKEMLYYHAMREKRHQLVRNIRFQLSAMRGERQKTRQQLRKLQAIRRKRATAATAAKHKKNKVSKNKNIAAKENQKEATTTTTLLSNGLSRLHLASFTPSSSISSSVVTSIGSASSGGQDAAWLANASSPLSEDCIDVDDTHKDKDVRKMSIGAEVHIDI